MSQASRSKGYSVLFSSILLVCIVIVYFSFRMFMGSLSAVQAQLFLDDWQDKRALTSEQAYLVAREAAETSLLWYPVSNGSYWQRLGQIDEWRFFPRPFGDSFAQPVRETSLNAYREAVTYKTQWPYLWARLANIKLQLGQWDVELINALHQIDQTGPWRPLATRDLVEIGFLAWPSLDAETQQMVLEAASRTLSANRQFALDVEATAKHAGKLDLLCDFLVNNARETRHLCQ